MGARRGSRKGREAMVERRHGGVGPLEELWHPEQLTEDVAGKSLVGGMLLERVGSAALLYMLVASTPCMGGLLCAPSGEVGRRGNFCMLCILCFSSSSSSLQSAPQTCCPSPKVKCQTRSGLRPSLSSLLRRSLLLRRKPMLVWKRRTWCWEGASSLERKEGGRAGRELRGSELRRSGPAQKAKRPRAASRGHQ